MRPTLNLSTTAFLSLLATLPCLFQGVNKHAARIVLHNNHNNYTKKVISEMDIIGSFYRSTKCRRSCLNKQLRWWILTVHFKVPTCSCFEILNGVSTREYGVCFTNSRHTCSPQDRVYNNIIIINLITFCWFLRKVKCRGSQIIYFSLAWHQLDV